MPAVNKDILIWARKTASLSLEEAAKAIDLNDAYGKSGAERLAEFENGIGEPSRPLLLRMSKAYRRSLLVFYLAAPPPTGDLGDDFRRLPGAEPPLYNAVVDALIRDVRGRQSIIKAIQEEAEVPRLRFVGSVNMEVPFDVLADRVSTEFAFNLAEFRAQPSIPDAFAYLRSKIEENGVFVLLLGNLGSHHTNIPVDVFRGYAIADEIAPLILINDQDAQSAWSFTALHELTHLWLGTTGLSGWATEQEIEQYCNDVASQILLPAVELHQLDVVTRTRPFSFERLVEGISKFSWRRRISRAMVAYRLFRGDFIRAAIWHDLREYFRDEWLEKKKREAQEERKGDGGPDYYVVRRHRLGKALLDFTTRSLGEGALTYTQASMLLGVKPRNIDPLLFPELPARGKR
jgi:Zn-dependent peptidase ImmA (M78 family)